MTLVPAGCRSPGRCCGNHSHQPDGISVGEREKDGSGSALPGPAWPGDNSPTGDVPGEREVRTAGGVLACEVTRRTGRVKLKIGFDLCGFTGM